MPTASNVPPTLDLHIDQGSNFYQPLFLRKRGADGVAGPVYDLTGCVVRAHVRKDRSESADLVVAFTCAVMDVTAGQVDIYLTAAQTAALHCGALPTHPASQYVWDIEIEDAFGNILRLRRGSCSVYARATRATF